MRPQASPVTEGTICDAPMELLPVANLCGWRVLARAVHLVDRLIRLELRELMATPPAAVLTGAYGCWQLESFHVGSLGLLSLRVLQAADAGQSNAICLC